MVCITRQKSLSISVLQQVSLPQEFEKYESNPIQLSTRVLLSIIGDFLRGTSWGYVLNTENPSVNMQTSGRRFCQTLTPEILEIFRASVESIRSFEDLE